MDDKVCLHNASNLTFFSSPRKFKIKTSQRPGQNPYLLNRSDICCLLCRALLDCGEVGCHLAWQWHVVFNISVWVLYPCSGYLESLSSGTRFKPLALLLKHLVILPQRYGILVYFWDLRPKALSKLSKISGSDKFKVLIFGSHVLIKIKNALEIVLKHFTPKSPKAKTVLLQ